MYSIYKQCVSGGGGGMLNCAVDHILEEFYTLFLTRFRTYKIASRPQTKEMTSKDDIKGLMSLKFLRPWLFPSSWWFPQHVLYSTSFGGVEGIFWWDFLNLSGESGPAGQFYLSTHIRTNPAQPLFVLHTFTLCTRRKMPISWRVYSSLKWTLSRKWLDRYISR